MAKVYTGPKLSVVVHLSGTSRDRNYPALLAAAYRVFGDHTCEVRLTPRELTATGMPHDDEWGARARELGKLAGCKVEEFSPRIVAAS